MTQIYVKNLLGLITDQRIKGRKNPNRANFCSDAHLNEMSFFVLVY